MAWTAEQRREYLQSRGFIAPDNDGFFGEAGQAAAQSFVSAARGVGATINELTGNASVQDYFQGVLDRNQQWNPAEDGGIGSYIGRAIGSAAGSTAGALAAGAVGSLVGGPAAGVAAGVATVFSQSFGENVQRNREAGYGENKAYGMAFLESSVDAAIENLPFGIIGKSGKLIAQAGRLNAISKAGKRELLNMVGKRIAAATGTKETQSALARLGKEALMSGLGEAGEEGLQYLNSYINQTLGGDPNANISLEDLADSIAQGFLGGFVLGGAQNTPTALSRTRGGNAVNSQALETNDQERPLFDTLVSEVGNALGIKVDFMDTLENSAELEKKGNGLYDKSSKTLYLNRNSYEINPAATLGHELKHYIDDSIPELSKAFNSLLETGKNEEANQFIKEYAEKFKVSGLEANSEFSADIFGELFARPETWQRTAEYLDDKTPGMGEKFLQTLKDFYELVKAKLSGIATPEAETFVNNINDLQNEAARMLADLQKRNKEKAEAVVSAENAQTTQATTQETTQVGVSQMESTTAEESVVKDNLTTEAVASTPKENLEVEESSENRKSQETVPETESVEETQEVTPEESVVKDEESVVKQSAFDKLKDRSAEIGFTFDKFYEDFAPQLEAIIAKARRAFEGNLGNDIENDWRDSAYEAMAKAYMAFDPKVGNKISTVASKAIVNAINSVNRKHKRNFEATGGNISLDQTNEQGETLSEAVADENASAVPEEKSKDLIGDYRKWKSTLKPRDQRILDLSESGKSPSVIARTKGIGMTSDEVKTRLRELAIAARSEGELLFSRKRGENIEDVNNNFNNDLERQINGALPSSYIYQLGRPGDILLSTGVPDLPIELSSTRLSEKSKQGNHPFNIADLKDLPKALQNPVAVFAYGDPEKAQNIIVEIQSDGKNYLVGLSLNSNFRGIAVNDIRGLFPKETAFWLRWIQQGKSLYLNKEKVQSLIAQQRTNLAEVSNLDLNSINNIIKNFKNANDNLQFSRKRSSEQIIPVVVDGKVREEYADLLSERKYTVQTLKALQGKALEWIKRNGGVVPSVQALLKDSAPADPAVAEIARRMLLNSEVFAESVSRVDRTKLYEMEQDTRSDWGRTGRAMQLAALKLKDVASVQAVLNKLHKDMKDAELLKLRNQIKDELDVDIFNLPDDIVENKSKLDAVLRKHLTHAANIGNKFYEYYINAILSGPTTHISNLLGNTANAVYELGIKRFTEALVNIAAGRKDGATFGEFRQMAKAFNWRNAWEAAKKSFDLEVLDPAGKYLENNNVAIGGKTGRFIRISGRALKAADAFAKALIEPVETAAYAYRMGVQQGLSDRELAAYIRQQLADVDSDAYQWGKERARELTFQEDPGDVVNRLMALRESDGVMGTTLKIFLPFIKTPYNILRQGIRKGPVGTLNLAMEFGKLALGKRKFDGELVARTAEQLLAWGTFMAFYGLSDDDDLPLLTGTSSAYGSAEYGFKANKIPPYSIRLGNTWYSYQRIEPLATGLAAIADGLQAIRDVRNGKDATKAMSETIGATVKVIGEKSFLDSIGEIIKVLEDPERNAMRPATNLLASAMPALIRQSRQAFTEEVGESKSRNQGTEWWKDQFSLIINRAGITTAIPKVDYFGRDIKKDDWSNSWLSDIGRLLPIKRFEADRNMDKAERLIWNYNQRNPNEEYYPGVPRGTFTHNGVKMYFAGEDYREFAIQSGQLAHKQINNAIKANILNVNAPDADDIKLIQKIFTRARKEIQNKMVQQKRGKQL